MRTGRVRIRNYDRHKYRENYDLIFRTSPKSGKAHPTTVKLPECSYCGAFSIHPMGFCLKCGTKAET